MKTTENLKLLRSLRQEEKSIKSQIAAILPDALEEAKQIQPEGGKFTLPGVGDFVLDVVPVYELADYRRYREEEAKQWRRDRREQRIARNMASSYTASMRTQMDRFIRLYGDTKTPDSIDLTLKCLGLD